jgi:hypothetical protein
MVLFSSNIGNALWVMLLLSLVLPWLRERRRNRVAHSEA